MPEHSAPDSIGPIWAYDLLVHGLSVWKYSLAAAARLGYGEVLSALKEAEAVSVAEERWRVGDPLIAAQAKLRAELAHSLVDAEVIGGRG